MSLPTSITLFIGMAHKGDLGRPTTIYGMAQFEQIFGSDFSYGELALQVRQFFLNGGIEAIVVRIAGDDGGTPELGDYENVFSALESTVDLFNVLILPRGFEQTDDQRQLLWGAASAGMRIGAVIDHASIYWPRIKVASALLPIDPAGTIAGIISRTDIRHPRGQ